MNQRKESNGWILCPSKSCPGKFYYFNVLTGEAAWSLNETENQTLKKGYRIHKIADKSHSFPEPSGPPIDDTSNVSFVNNSLIKKPIYNAIPKRVINNTQSPTFGHAIFPKYVEPFMPNIIWAPIQLPPMYVTPDMGMNIPIDRIGQHCDSDRSLFVQTCDLSLSKRFEMYSKQFNIKTMVDNRDFLNKLSKKQSNYKAMPENKNFFNKFYETSTPIKSSFDGKIMDNSQMFGLKENVSFQSPKDIKPKSLILKPVLKKVRTHSESEIDSRALASINKANSAESLLNLDNTAFMKSTLTGGNKVENSSNIVKENLDNLGRNDLRFLLVAKRRKSVDLGDLCMSSEAKKIKTYKDEMPKTTPKKRVTFDLGDQVSSDGVDDQMEITDNPDDEVRANDQDIEDSLLYIAVDLDTLLDEYEFVEEYTQSDDNRRLLIPHKLQAAIEAVCLGDCRGRQRVIAARQITRKLVTPPPHYVLLPESEDSTSGVQCLVADNHSDNYILNTCLQVLDAGDQVMLITNNTDLYNNAKSLNIDCYKTQELKEGPSSSKPEVSFDLKRTVNVSNENKTNLFLQPANQFEPYLVKNKEEITVDSFKKRLFVVEDNNDFPKTKNTLKDANTSPIGSQLLDLQTDKLIDITRKKLPSMPQLETNVVNEIGLDMQNLFIKEKPNDMSTEKQNANVRFENRNVEKRKETKQRGSESKSLDRTSLDDLLSVNSVQNKDLEESIRVRLDEWTCCFTQLMENALVEVLMEHSPITDKLSPPWVLYESVRRIQDLYGSHTEVKMVAKKLKDMLLNHSSKIGKLKSSISPNDFLKIVGCGVTLIETLKSIQPSTSLHEAANSINTLLRNMTEPTPDIPIFSTPVLNYVEQDTAREERRNYIKKPSEIIEYLKANFPQWKDFEIPPEYDDERQPRVVRTFGRDLNLLKIDNNKSITLNTRTDKIMKALNDSAFNKAHSSTKIDGITALKDEKQQKPTQSSECDNGNTKKSPVVIRKFDSSFVYKIGNDKYKPTSTTAGINIIENAEFFSEDTKANGETTEKLSNTNNVLFTNDFKNVPKFIRIFDNKFNQINNEKVTTTIDDDLNVPKHGNTFNQGTETAGPKVIRNIKPIEEFEGKFKENPKMLDLDALDYSEIVSLTENMENYEEEITESVSFVYAIKEQNRKPTVTNSNDKNIEEINDNALDNDDGFAQRKINDDSAFNNDVDINNDNANDSVINDCSVALNNESDDKVPVRDDTTNDSGFENESVHAYLYVKVFLAELSNSVRELYEFMIKSIDKFNKHYNQEDKKRLLHEKANQTQTVIAWIINALKSIIEREASEAAVKSVLLKAGVQAASDKRITRYRQVITKVLEQAQVLENALKDVLALTDSLDAASVSSNTNHTDIRYFNIFE